MACWLACMAAWLACCAAWMPGSVCERAMPDVRRRTASSTLDFMEFLLGCETRRRRTGFPFAGAASLQGVLYHRGHRVHGADEAGGFLQNRRQALRPSG